MDVTAELTPQQKHTLERTAVSASNIKLFSHFLLSTVSSFTGCSPELHPSGHRRHDPDGEDDTERKRLLN